MQDTMVRRPFHIVGTKSIYTFVDAPATLYVSADNASCTSKGAEAIYAILATSIISVFNGVSKG
jgi:hypothetical protein